MLAATLTLLPAVLAKLGPRVDKLSLPWVHSGEHRSPRSAGGGERLWRHPLRYGIPALGLLVVLALPVTQLRTSMPSIKVVPSSDSSRVGYQQVQSAFGPGATGPLQLVAPAGDARVATATVQGDPGIAQVMPAQRSGVLALIQAIPRNDPSSTEVGSTIDRLRADLPAGTMIGGAVAENHDLQAVFSAKTPIVIGVVLALGFPLLLVVLQAPLIAAAGVVTNLLATGAAFGVAKWIFQDGGAALAARLPAPGLPRCLGPRLLLRDDLRDLDGLHGFLLSVAKEHGAYARCKEAMVGGLAHSGRVIFAAGAVMVAVFFTFALSGPLPPKEMGLILGIAVLLDAMLIRLLLMPVLLRLLGPWAWYLPSWADRVLPSVRFGHA